MSDRDLVLAEISKNPGQYADEVAEGLGLPVGKTVRIIGELIDSGVIEHHGV